jgi:lysozyme family protein
MKEMSVDAARVIYRREYWDKCKADAVSELVRFPLFDGAVNSGVSQSIKWLQQALGQTEDGVIGPRTLAADKNTPSHATASKMLGHRLQFMSALSTWPAFGRGWANRIAKNLIEA